MWLLFVAACAHHPPAAPHPPARYTVTAILGSPEHFLTSTYSVLVERGPGGATVFRTVESKVTVEDGANTFAWDSASPDPREPWVVSQERAVAGVPATVILDGAGRPVEVLDLPAWQTRARAALLLLGLPPQAHASGEALLDGPGLIRGLARDFPGSPTEPGPWKRTEWIGDRLLHRSETCVSAGPERWTCDGVAEGVGFKEGTSQTLVTWDAHGLLELDARWDAIAVAAGPSGEVAERAVAGRRRVVREAR